MAGDCGPAAARGGGLRDHARPLGAGRTSCAGRACRRRPAGREESRVKIFSGIQPTGEPHIGNYSGGFRQYAKTQEQGTPTSIVDLHAITVDFDPAELREATLDIAAMLFATGLDAERSTVFVQSQVTAHAERVAARGCDELRRAPPDDPVQGEGRPAGVRHRRALLVPGADGGTSSCTRPTSSRSATTSGSTSSSRATSRSASTRGSARPSRCPKASTPRRARG